MIPDKAALAGWTKSRDALLTREPEKALRQAVFTTATEQRREFESRAKRRKGRAASWPNATG